MGHPRMLIVGHMKQSKISAKGKIMNTRHHRIFFLLIIICVFIAGCSTGVVEETASTEEAIIVEADADTDLYTQEQEEHRVRFTIEAEADLHKALTALYQAYFSGELPEFVNSDGDLSVAGIRSENSIHPTFLPGSILIPKKDSQDLIDFIAFAISPDGQQVLIDAGELPSVITLTDQAGNSIQIQQPVSRVISAFGPATSVVYSIDAANRLVAASYTGAGDPKGSAVMSQIDPRFPDLISDDFFSRSEFNIEHAALLEPDLIIASTRSAWLEAVDQLGIQVFLMDAETPEQLREAVLLIGQLFGPHSSAQAQNWVAYYNEIIERISAQTDLITKDDRIQVLFTGTEPLRVASGDMYQTFIIEAAGGVSVSSGLDGYWNDVNLEQVALWNPDLIVVPSYGGASVEAITDNSDWQILAAVQAGRVYQMPRVVVPWDTPAPDSVMGIIWLAGKINPDLIDLDCEVEVAYFYNTFLNYPISGEEIDTICTID